jgi:hypothetical protein
MSFRDKGYFFYGFFFSTSRTAKFTYDSQHTSLSIHRMSILCDIHSVIKTVSVKGKGKGKAIPVQAWTSPYGSMRLSPPEFLDSRHMKVAAYTPRRDPLHAFRNISAVTEFDIRYICHTLCL